MMVIALPDGGATPLSARVLHTPGLPQLRDALHRPWVRAMHGMGRAGPDVLLEQVGLS